MSGIPVDPPAPAASKSPALRPRDAATLILVDNSQGLPRVLLGKRRMDMKFMPGKYVFPGGRVDRPDRTVESTDDLAESEISKLLVDMKGGPNPARARALALAAVRETYEWQRSLDFPTCWMTAVRFKRCSRTC